MSRSLDLLKLAAQALDNGVNPLNEAFLKEHDVTLDEVYTLAEQLSLGATIVAWLASNQNNLVAASIINNLHMAKLNEAIRNMRIGRGTGR